jgi:hypothetical protein
MITNMEKKMKLKGYQKLIISLLVSSPILEGCAGYKMAMRVETAVKNAYIMYYEQKTNLGQPSPRWYRLVDTDIGRDSFVADLSHFVNTKYQCEAIYAIGWFGDDRHIPLIAPRLEDPDPEVRRVTLAAFRQLTKQDFKNTAQAHEWWKQNKSKYPPFRYNTETTTKRKKSG